MTVEPGPGLDHLTKVAESLSEYFQIEGILKEPPQPFKAHLTVAKISQLFNRKGPRPRVHLSVSTMIVILA